MSVSETVELCVAVGSLVWEPVFLVLLSESVGVRSGVSYSRFVGLSVFDSSCLLVAVGLRVMLAVRGPVGEFHVALCVFVGRYTISVDPVVVYGGMGSDDSPPYSQKYA